MLKSYKNAEQETEAYSECHTRSAQRVLKALLANGGVFIKMGQHIASLVVLPVEWTSTMKVLQDKCEPTQYEALEALFLSDMGEPISEIFDDFDPEPIGVASLAQVHIGRHKASGKTVAVKHPHLAEFCDVDMEMVDATLGWIKYWFPDFEFTWLGEEMRTNLPKEMDFVHEANNAARTKVEFACVRTSLYIPEVVLATKRVLIMEYIKGGRVDDLKYLSACDIDRNKVAVELSRIFNQMVFVNGWFHADPHPGNLLIRPKVAGSKSPYNFEIVLLDHGLYFDMESKLRVNYSKLWLSLMAPASESTISDRRKLAELVGNIGPDLYPVFEAALTGRVALEGSWDEQNDVSFQRASSLIDMVPQTEEEKDAIRAAVMQKEGVLLSVFDVLRRIPRRVLMVLKLNDLTRSLDHALKTTHSNVRIFLVTAKYCSAGLLSLSLLTDYFSCWWRYQRAYLELSMVESLMDLQAYYKRQKAWFYGLWRRGLRGAHDASFGLPYSFNSDNSIVQHQH
ncbi:ABC1 family protein MCP2-like protein [Psilocybe cubensis]|uniref:ABC1 family protein MCP2-like protein n=1 Tax=Psilocybe cubensis TaxID=181762 RepID=A0ACB8HCL3_PSICU|nr:ABC1 family protein MCP2-like protein [Psilocybe cubensis]KAH9485382.1 ABC1 family protein MCP2-like protein [Psilocybe cubensis]